MEDGHLEETLPMVVQEVGQLELVMEDGPPKDLAMASDYQWVIEYQEFGPHQVLAHRLKAKESAHQLVVFHQEGVYLMRMVVLGSVHKK